MEKTTYKGWENAVRLANGAAELILTADIGPRAIRFAFLGEENEFHEDSKWVGKSGDSEYHSYGGHRLWHAPESAPRTYSPDNRPVAVEPTAQGVRLLPPPEADSGIQKEWLVWLSPTQAHARIRHRLTNLGPWPVPLAPWAITIMACGGVGILPLPPRLPHDGNLLPTGRLALWSYTDMSGPRWRWGGKYILLRQDPQRPDPQKLGTDGSEGWAAYCRGNHLFLKTYTHQPDAEYPDHGSSAELFTNGHILEVETLGPLTRLDPGRFVDHWENWFLFDSVPVPAGDADVDRDVLPRVAEARRLAASAENPAPSGGTADC
jgi:hypothetical protein